MKLILGLLPGGDSEDYYRPHYNLIASTAMDPGYASLDSFYQSLVREVLEDDKNIFIRNRINALAWLLQCSELPRELLGISRQIQTDLLELRGGAMRARSKVSFRVSVEFSDP